MGKDNLNNYCLSYDSRDDDKGSWQRNDFNSGDINVYFRNIKQRLMNHIFDADIVVGCVAWLTDFDILECLSTKNVSIIVQKEDFLRPDMNSGVNWKGNIRKAYDKLKFGYDRYDFEDNIMSSLSVASDPSVEPVRCVGNYNSDKKPAFPRMHNKFLVFCKYQELPEDDWGPEGTIKPYGVWTGSFNFTNNAGYSLENALYISDPLISMAYFKEYGFIAGLSEPLDWRSVWCEPEWRIGT